jgi:hypothetical protein
MYARGLGGFFAGFARIVDDPFYENPQPAKRIQLSASQPANQPANQERDGTL